MVAILCVVLTRMGSGPVYNTVVHALTMFQNAVKTTAEIVQTIDRKCSGLQKHHIRHP